MLSRFDIFKNLVFGRRGFDIPMFRDKAVQQNLKRQGYHVCEQPVSAEVVQQLLAAYERFMELYEKPLPDTFYASGDTKSSAARTHVLQSMDRLLVPEIKKLIDERYARAEPAIFQIKPPNEKKELNAHQDSALVDEDRYFSTYVWVSLIDSTPENGALWVLPGSHRFGNIHRSNFTTWQFHGFEDIMRRYWKVLPTKAGQMVIFDCALIHGSLQNKSGKVRVAASGVVMPKEAPLIMSYIGKDIPEGTTDVFEVNREYFLCDDIYARPSSKYKLVGNFPFRRLNLDRNSFEWFCKLNKWLT